MWFLRYALPAHKLDKLNLYEKNDISLEFIIIIVEQDRCKYHFNFTTHIFTTLFEIYHNVLKSIR